MKHTNTEQHSPLKGDATTMRRGTVGILMILTSLPLWFFDRTTHVIAHLLGKCFYGDHYSQTVDGIAGDASCGFNIDMHLSFFLIIVLILGVILYVSSKKTSEENS